MKSRHWRGWSAATSLGLAWATVLSPLSALAHHSYAMFDRAQKVVLEGTVRALAWQNPHGTIWVLIPQASGDPQLWTVQTGPVAAMVSAGFKQTDFKKGDKIKLTINPLKDGRTGGVLVSATLTDGRTLKEGSALP